MVDRLECVNQMAWELNGAKNDSEPKDFLLSNYSELLKERVIIDVNGKEIGDRLKNLIEKAKADSRTNQKRGELLPRAIIRNALRRLNYDFCKITLGGLPTGPAYERSLPDRLSPRDFGHEKVGYPMSDYPHLSYLPVGGLGTPMCEVDYSTCYLKEGFMVQDKSIRKLTVQINGKNYDLAKAEGTYHALYPFSERAYNLPMPFSVLQYSPIIPGDYQTSSLPVEIMEINAENPTDKPVSIIFTITQENILGWYPKKGYESKKKAATDSNAPLVWNRQSKENKSEKLKSGVGVIFSRDGDQKNREAYQKNFVRTGTGIAGQIAIVSNNIPGQAIVTPIIRGDRSAGLKIKLTIPPQGKVSHSIAVAYDLPFHHFQYDPTKTDSPSTRMPKFYTRTYGETGQNAEQIAVDALRQQAEWKERIIKFQKTITEDKRLPDFFKQALLNELYVLAETGIWEADQGRFAYLESIDYKMYNTSDVNSYTWALLTLFPELERKDLLEFAKLVPLSDPRRRWFNTDRVTNVMPRYQHFYMAPIKESGAVCHDLGGLLAQGVFPFTNSCNEFDWSNSTMWIDLAPKFALRTWRYFTFMQGQTGKQDLEFIRTVYPSIKMALDTLERRWSDKSTHVPVSKGIPDWTYDTISGEGFTPNVVTQWLAALEAAQAMAKLMGDKVSAEKYASWQQAGKPVLDKMWNKKGYFNAFVSPDAKNVNSNVHSDMLFGDFYARMTGISPVVPNNQATKALETLYRTNAKAWSRVGTHGPLGLVNLRGPKGEQILSEQGDEGWTGTMLFTAAYMIKLGMETNNNDLVQKGWNVVHGFFNVVHSNSPDSQHWFGRTPEGYVNPDDIKDRKTGKKYKEGKVLPNGMVVPATGRAPKYMRALAIWAVYAAITDNKMPFNIYQNRLLEQKDTFPLPYGGEKQK